jgi:hypothetical protein
MLVTDRTFTVPLDHANPGGERLELFAGEVAPAGPRPRACARRSSRAGCPALYDPARLAANQVPVAAAVYFNDMYVPAAFSLPTAAAVRGLRAWVTSEYEHDGLRASSDVFGRLIGMARGRI